MNSAVTQLNLFAQSNHVSPPRYVFKPFTTGENSIAWSCHCHFATRDKSGKGASKKVAKERAATHMSIELGIRSVSSYRPCRPDTFPNPIPPPPTVPVGTPLSQQQLEALEDALDDWYL